MMKKLIVAADGSSLGNPGPAGWCWFVDEKHWQAGGWESATNNQAELTAVLDLLQATSTSGEALEILCDSQYVINCCTKWMPKWKQNGWRKADKKPVENQELLRQLDTALADREVEFKWVKGHAGHDLNEAADERARAVATAYREKTKPDFGPGLGVSEGEHEQVATSENTQTSAVGGKLPQESSVRKDSQLKNVDSASMDCENIAVAELEPALIDTEKIMQTLLELERELLSPQVRSDTQMLRTYLHDEYIAHASNGQIWDLEAGLRAGIQPLGPSQLKALGLVALGDSYLLRWSSIIDGRKSTRVSLWQRGGVRGWQLRFTQATLEK